MSPEISMTMAIAVFISFFFIITALFLTLWCLVRGPNLAYRVIVMDLIESLAVGLIAGYCILTQNATFLSAAVVLCLITFLGTVMLARYLARERE